MVKQFQDYLVNREFKRATFIWVTAIDLDGIEIQLFLLRECLLSAYGVLQV